MWWSYLILLFMFKKSLCVINNLNDTEYDRMPRLWTLDEYEPCLRRGGAYCVGRFDLYADAPSDLLTRIHEYSASTKKHYNHTYVEKGVCLSECEHAAGEGTGAESDARALERCVDARMRRQHGLRASLAALYYCERRGDARAPDRLDWAVAYLLLAILAANVLGTLYDELFVKDPNDNFVTDSYLTIFSLRRSWASLVYQSDEPRFRNLSALHGLKCITTIFVVLSHVFFLSTGFTDNPLDFEKGYDSWHFQLLVNGMSLVQIFFVISGFLLVYNIQIHLESKDMTWFTLPKIYFYRWWRLSPANAIVLAFSATWLRYLGSGPLWNLHVAYTVVNDCRKYWWAHLLYFENYMENDKYCNLQTWHLSADMQAFVVGAFVCFATRVRGRYWALAFLFMVGMFTPALKVLQGMDPLIIFTPETFRTMVNDTYHYVHNAGHVNIAGFVIGMATGHLVGYLQKRKVDLKKYDKMITLYCWCYIPAMVFCFLSGGIFYEDDVEVSLLTRMLYAASHRNVIALLTAFGIVAMSMECAASFFSFFSWKGWITLNKLCYGVYLLHMNIVHIIFGSKSQLGHFSFFHVCIIHLGVLSLSLALAVPFYLLLESPMNRLARTLFTGRAHAQHKQSDKIK